MQSPVWLFDLDNTLHDASHAVFGQLNNSMTQYIADHLNLPWEQASDLRASYWRRYGATLLGLQKHHGICGHDFLHQTHQLPKLEVEAYMPRADKQAIRHLPGRKFVLTNAPRAYAERVLKIIGLSDCFEAVIAIEDMQAFGAWRPKPDARMLHMLLAQYRIQAHQCVLVDDAPENLKSARRLGLRTVWMQRYAGHPMRQAGGTSEVGIHLHGRPRWACAKITRLRTLHHGRAMIR